MGTVLTQFTVDGVALWVVLLICGGVFLGSFMDAIAGGGGIITVPTYLMGLLQNGFAITAVAEPMPPREMWDIPGMKDEMRRPMMLIIRAVKQ